MFGLSDAISIGSYIFPLLNRENASLIDRHGVEIGEKFATSDFSIELPMVKFSF